MIGKFFKNLGPGLITAALVFGPGSLTVTTKLGAGFSTQLLWVIVVAVIFMIAYTRLSAAIGLHLDGSLIEEVRQQYGKWAALALGTGIFFISASFQAGNSIGAGISFSELLGGSTTIWILLVSLSAIALLFFRSFYQILEKIMIVLVMIMLLAFLATVFLSRPSVLQILNGLVPRAPQGSELLAIALMASSFSIVGAFYQSTLVKEKGWKLAQLKQATAESQNGIIILGGLSMLVMICAASVLYDTQGSVNSATELGLALQPLFGDFASNIFMVGFFSASYSSLIGNATIGGGLLADSLSLGSSLQDRSVRWCIMIIIAIGSLVAILFGALPLELIVFAQALTIIVAPAAAITLLLVAYKKRILRSPVTNTLSLIILVAGLATLVFLALYHLKRIFL